MPTSSVTVLSLLLVSLSSLVAAIATWLRTTGPGPVSDVPVALVIPVTGGGVDLERLCGALAAQSLPPRQLVFVVESKADPAHERLLAALAATSLQASVLVTGPTTKATQKCHNLALALAEIDDGKSIVVLADADIVPQTGWLNDLVRPIVSGRAECVSGYRWSIPTDARLGTLLIVWIDRAIASMPKFQWMTMAWAGSFAFAPGVLKRLGAVKLLSGAVSDDMSLAQAASDHGCPALYRLRVLVPSPVSHSLASCFGFGIRQYQMLLLHQPRIWASGLATIAVLLAVRGSLWIAAAMSPFWLQVFAGFIALNWVTYAVRLQRARYLNCWPIRSKPAETLLWLMPLAGPLIDLMHLAAFLLSARLDTIHWSHLTYRLKDGKVASIERREWT